jgi:hypothetical protein
MKQCFVLEQWTKETKKDSNDKEMQLWLTYKQLITYYFNIILFKFL